MILFWQEVKECYTSATYLHEKTFRDLGSGFVYYIVIGTSVYKKWSRTTKNEKIVIKRENTTSPNVKGKLKKDEKKER